MGALNRDYKKNIIGRWEDNIGYRILTVYKYRRNTSVCHPVECAAQ